MRISPIANFYPTRINTGITSNKNVISGYNSQNKQINNVSFAGNTVYLKGQLRDINKNDFPDELYLNLDNVYEKFENEDRTYHRWEKFRFDLVELAAKRCNYLGITENAKGSSIGQDKNTVEMSISEFGKKEYPKSIDLEWTKEYKELENFFKGPKYFMGAEDNMDSIKEGLPEILKRQGWIK